MHFTFVYAELLRQNITLEEPCVDGLIMLTTVRSPPEFAFQDPHRFLFIILDIIKNSDQLNFLKKRIVEHIKQRVVRKISQCARAKTAIDCVDVSPIVMAV